MKLSASLLVFISVAIGAVADVNPRNQAPPGAFWPSAVAPLTGSEASSVIQAAQSAMGAVLMVHRQRVLAGLRDELAGLLSNDFRTRERAQETMRRMLDCESQRSHPLIAYAALSSLLETHGRDADTQLRLSRLRERYAPLFLGWDAFIGLLDEAVQERARTQASLNLTERILYVSEKILKEQGTKLRDLKKAEDFGQVLEQAFLRLKILVLVSKDLVKVLSHRGKKYVLTLEENGWPGVRVIRLESMDAVDVAEVLRQVGFRADYSRLPTGQSIEQIPWQPLTVGLGLKRELTAGHYVPYSFMPRSSIPQVKAIEGARTRRFDYIYYFLTDIFSEKSYREDISESIERLSQLARLPMVLLPARVRF